MLIKNYYSPFFEHWHKTGSARSALAASNSPWLQDAATERAPDFEEHAHNHWKPKSETALAYIEQLPDTLTRIHAVAPALKTLPGELHLIPSLGYTDGFARYDRGSHTVYLGIDHPDADIDYLRALTAHELSHVLRDHSPEVWAHLGKPLAQITRKEYLAASSAEEHLASEGLATLFSQHIFPEIDARVHHFYEPDEWQWIARNLEHIESALTECLSTPSGCLGILRRRACCTRQPWTRTVLLCCTQD